MNPLLTKLKFHIKDKNLTLISASKNKDTNSRKKKNKRYRKTNLPSKKLNHRPICSGIGRLRRSHKYPRSKRVLNCWTWRRRTYHLNFQRCWFTPQNYLQQYTLATSNPKRSLCISPCWHWPCWRRRESWL